MPDIGTLLKMLLEVAVFAVIIYIALRFLRETRGSGVVRGLALLLVAGVLGFALLIQFLKLDHLRILFNSVAQSVILALVIVFHPEIRQAIVHIGESPIFGRLFQQESKIVPRVLRAVARMSKERIGALIAIEREASLQSIADSGITIDAELNSFLIESIFFPKSALHDGAIIVRDDRIVAASCLLPLSQSPEVDKRLGTRHRAALGLSEETDALAIVVSEETGKISTAIGGKLAFDRSLEDIERQLEQALGNLQPISRSDQRRRSMWMAITSDPLRKLAALALGIGMYYVLDNQIHEAWGVQLQLRAIKPGASANPDFTHGNQLLIDLPLERIELRGFVDVATSKPIQGVELTVSGPRYLIENLRRDQLLELPVKLPQVDWEKFAAIEFTAADIQRPLQLAQQNVMLTMDPARVRIDAVPTGSIEYQLGLNLVELQIGGDNRLRGRLRTDTAEFSRPTVRVLGPSAALATLSNLTDPLFRADLRARESDRQVSAPVVIQSRFADQGLSIFESASVTLQLMPVMQEFTFDLQVRIDDLSLPADQRGRYQPDLTTKQVTVKAGGALLSKLIGEGDRAAAWAKDHLRLSVWIKPREEGSAYPVKFTDQATLEVLGPLRDSISAQEFGLVESVSVTLRRPGP